LHAKGIQPGPAQATFKSKTILPKLGGMLEISILSNIRRVGRKGHRRLAAAGKEVVLGILSAGGEESNRLEESFRAASSRKRLCRWTIRVERTINQLWRLLCPAQMRCARKRREPQPGYWR